MMFSRHKLLSQSTTAAQHGMRGKDRMAWGLAEIQKSVSPWQAVHQASHRKCWKCELGIDEAPRLKYLRSLVSNQFLGEPRHPVPSRHFSAW